MSEGLLLFCALGALWLTLVPALETHGPFPREGAQSQDQPGQSHPTPHTGHLSAPLTRCAPLSLRAFAQSFLCFKCSSLSTCISTWPPSIHALISAYYHSSSRRASPEQAHTPARLLRLSSRLCIITELNNFGTHLLDAASPTGLESSERGLSCSLCVFATGTSEVLSSFVSHFFSDLHFPGHNTDLVIVLLTQGAQKHRTTC